MKSNIINYGLKYVNIIEDVFTIEECQKLIEISEKKGYTYETSFLDKRKSKRSIIDNDMFSERLFNIIYKYLPLTYNNKNIKYINPRFRFLKYDIGDYFTRHRDGNYVDAEGNQSLITILIYLNNDYEGGYTTFFSDPDDYNGYIIVPKPGMICLMDQEIGHEVNSLISGNKYVIRTEIMYN
jgi:hypothetical protein